MTLRAEQVAMRFAGLAALQDVTVSFGQGEVVGLIGPNGSGKTTLVNVLSGVLRPTAGTVGLGERRWHAIPPHKAARLGIRRTFQNIRLFEEMTVLETVEVPAAGIDRNGDRRESALAVLQEVGLVPYRDQLAQTLPHGLQKRLEIARALAGRAVFLLLDEPTAGLSRAESDELVDMLLAVRESRGCGMVLIDHDLRVIMSACSRVVVLNEGRVISEGDPETVRSDPEVIKAYLG